MGLCAAVCPGLRWRTLSPLRVPNYLGSRPVQQLHRIRFVGAGNGRAKVSLLDVVAGLGGHLHYVLELGRDGKRLTAGEKSEDRTPPSVLSENESSIFADDLADWLKDQSIDHVRREPLHPQMQSKIER